MYFKSPVSAAPVLLILLTASLPLHAADPKICDLITRQQASAIAGDPVDAGAEQNLMKGASMCLFSATGSGGQTVSVGVMSKDAFYGGSAAAMFRIATTAKTGDTAESIPGLGEAAVLVTSGTDDDSLNILYHDRIINVDATGSKNHSLRASLIDAAKTILGKL
jgi:hypothetical protein